jgi:hypothetical protein
VAAGELSRQTLDGVHSAVAEFDGYRDGVDGDMAGLTQCGRRPGLRRFSGKLACWLGSSPWGPDREHQLQVGCRCRHPRRQNVIYITFCLCSWSLADSHRL